MSTFTSSRKISARAMLTASGLDGFTAKHGTPETFVRLAYLYDRQ
jgi:hypothetical protein